MLKKYCHLPSPTGEHIKNIHTYADEGRNCPDFRKMITHDMAELNKDYNKISKIAAH